MNQLEVRPVRAALRVASLFIWLAVVLWLSLAQDLPDLSSEYFLLSWDKLRHAGAYALMTFLAGFVFVLFSRTPLRGWLWGAAFAAAYGAMIEVAQNVLTDVRQAEFGDMLANFCGIGISLTGAIVWMHLTKQRTL